MTEAHDVGLDSRTNGPTEQPLTPEKIKPSSVALIAVTHFPKFRQGESLNETSEDVAKRESDTIRGRIALENLENYLDAGYKMIVVHSSRDIFWEKLLELQVKYQSLRLEHEDEDDRGLTAAKRKGIGIAASMAGINFIGQFELEKRLNEHMPTLLAQFELEGAKRVDVVMPNRGKEMEGYTDKQRRLEQKTNRDLTEIMRNANWLTDEEKKAFREGEQIFDWTNGTRIFRNTPELVEMFCRQYEVVGQLSQASLSDPISGKEEYVDARRWYDTLYGPIVEAFYKRWLSDGKSFKIASVAIDYTHHSSAAEEKSLRFDFLRDLQYQNIVPLARAHVRYFMAPYWAIGFAIENYPGMSVLHAFSRISSLFSDDNYEELIRPKKVA